MPAFKRDPDRLERAIGRMRSSIRAIPFAAIPLCAAVCAAPLTIFGFAGIIIGAMVGVIAGWYASTILASIIEWMMLMLVYLDDSHERD